MTYLLLYQIHQSGQMSEAQWQEHLRDEVFRAWLKRNGYDGPR